MVEPGFPVFVKPSLPTGSKLSLFGRILSPETALHQSVLSLADQGIASATTFLAGVIVARSCSKEELGLYMLGFSVVMFVTDMQTSLISTPYMVYGPRLKGKAHALYTGSSLIHQVAFSLLTMLMLVFGAIVVSLGHGPLGLGSVLWALAAVIGLIMLREFVRRVCFARLTLKAVLLVDICVGVGQIGGLALLAHLGLLSANRAYWLIGGVCALAVLCWLWLDRACYQLRVTESFADLKKNLKFGKWVFASGLVWALSMNLYPWLLAFFHGTASAGLWAACMGVVSAGNPVLLGIQNLVGPKIAHVYAAKGHEALNRLVFKITAVVTLPVSLLCFGLFIWGGRLLALLYGAQYAGNGLVVSVLAINLLIAVVTFSFSRALFAAGKANVDFWVNLAALLVMLTVGLWLVRAFGPIGAALGLLGANIVATAIRVTIFLRLPIILPRKPAGLSNELQ